MQAQHREDVEQEVRTFLSRFVDDPRTVEQPHLISGGVLDSLIVLQIIAFLERTYGLEVTDEDLDIANFDDLRGLVGFVVRKRQAADDR